MILLTHTLLVLLIELQRALVEMPRESLPPALINVIEGPGGTSSLINTLFQDSEIPVESRNADNLPLANPYFLIKCHNI
jgi:predicted GTPase